MRISIINEDKHVGINGEFYRVENLNIDPNIHAIQWYETWGEIEYKIRLENGRPFKPENTIIDNFSAYEFISTDWQLAKEAELKRIADEAEKKRKAEEEQLLKEQAELEAYIKEMQEAAAKEQSHTASNTASNTSSG